MSLNGFPDGLLQRAAHNVLAAQDLPLAPEPAVQPVGGSHPQSSERQALIRELGLRL